VCPARILLVGPLAPAASGLPLPYGSLAARLGLSSRDRGIGMGFWDDIQEKWLELRLAPRSRRFEPKAAVAGGSLEIDAVADEPGPDAFFDFLTPVTLFENKAPGEVFDGRDLMLCSARALLLAYRRKMPLAGLEQLGQVVLCSRATEEVREVLSGRELRPGIVEGRFQTRVVLVEADRLELLEQNVPLILHFASGEALRRAVEHIVEAELKQHYSVLFFLRREVFKEVLAMQGKTLDENEIQVREALEELGIRRVVEEIGLARVIEEVELVRVIEEVGLARVIEEVGLARVIEEVGLARVIEEAGLERVLESIGLERLEQALEQLRKKRLERPPGS
jgi:hypothetical protein